MTHDVLAPAPVAGLPAPRRAPREELTAAAVGPVPFNVLTPTGRLDQVLTAWGRGHLAEVPAGLTFDVLLTSGAVAEETIRRMRAAGRRVGPVVLGPCGGEFILERGSAPRWSAPRSLLLRPGTLVLLPPPTVCQPETVASRGWLVPPSHREAGAPLGDGLTPGGTLISPYLQAVQAVQAVEEAAAQLP
ncbi:hypothetical protein [Streptomyces vastus]|uniref:AraC family transcriptional regulator n=1 Tax=Streptomyces vastus TaxID=285451 RepID=A0ABN3QAP8_9ACTN